MLPAELDREWSLSPLNADEPEEAITWLILEANMANSLTDEGIEFAFSEFAFPRSRSGPTSLAMIEECIEGLLKRRKHSDV